MRRVRSSRRSSGSPPDGLVTHGRPLDDVDVLYLHGWSDYFFQAELAEFWAGLGARFYALDLRKYGRSLRPGQTPGYTTSLEVYDEDIRAALTVMGYPADGSPEHPRRLILVGHSTGGLTASLWASRHPGLATALVLNSPWLELQVGTLGRQLIAPAVFACSQLDPLGAHPTVDLGFYTRAQEEIGSAPAAAYPAEWRPAQGFPTHPAWLAAVTAGQEQVSRGIDVHCPALVMTSTASTVPLTWRPEMTRTDSVLNVDNIAHASTHIGTDVTLRRIDGGIHDLFLSSPEPRQAAYAALEHWLLRGAL